MATCGSRSVAMPSYLRSPCRRVEKQEDILREVWLPRSPQCVFHSWAAPEYVEVWCNVDGLADISATGELRAGGRHSLIALGPDGRGFRIEGKYSAIRQPDLIACTWNYRSTDRAWDSTIQVTFDEQGEGTLLRLLQSGISGEVDRVRQVQWWTERLDRLKGLLAGRL